MAATLASLRLELKDRLALSDDDPLVQDSDYARAINSALQAISAEHDWPWLLASASLSVVPTIDTITLPTTVSKAMVARIDNNDPLVFMSQDGLDLQFTPTDAGTPIAYTISGLSLVLRPVPQAAGTLKLTYYGTEPSLALDADPALIPARFQAAVIEKAANTLLRRTRDWARADEANVAYTQWISRMQDDQRRSAGSGTIKVRPGGWI